MERSTAGRATLGADRGYDVRGFVSELRALGGTPHVARNDRRWGSSAVDGRTTRHPGYVLSQRRRKLTEEVFGWLKTVGGGRKPRYMGPDRDRSWLEFAAASFNLVRMARLEAAPAQAQCALPSLWGCPSLSRRPEVVIRGGRRPSGGRDLVAGNPHPVRSR